VLPASAYAYDVYALSHWEMEARLLQTVGPGSNSTAVTAESVPFNVQIVRTEPPAPLPAQAQAMRRQEQLLLLNLTGA
jgi:hypothetical protein